PRLCTRGPARRTFRFGPQFDVRHLWVSPDGRWVGTGSHHHGGGAAPWNIIWEADTGRLVSALPSGVNYDNFHGFSPDSRWLYISGKETYRLDIASLVKDPLRPRAAAEERSLQPWREEWRREQIQLGGIFNPDNRLKAHGDKDGSIR